LALLDRIYNGLLVSLRRELKKPGNLIEHLHKRYLIFYNLLCLWREYTRYMRMGSEDVKLLIESKMSQKDTNEVADKIDLHNFTSAEDSSTSSDDDDLDINSIRNKMVSEFGETAKEKI